MASFQVAKVRGIPVRIHFSLLLILPLLAFLFANQLGLAAKAAEVPPDRLTGSPWLWGLGIAVALFASVLIHEFAHVWWALRSGGTVKDITLMMIGGVSRIEEAPSRSRDEAIMAVLGPLTSLALGFFFLGLWMALGGLDSWNLRMAFFFVGQLNVILGIFNLLPAFPMDGGRVVRALLVPRLGKAKATQIAGTIGKGFALLFAVLGLVAGNLILMVVALFVFMSASAETQQVMLETSLEGLRVKDVMAAGPDRVSTHAPLAYVIEEMRTRRILGVPVVDENGRVAGVTTLDLVRRTAPNRREDARASDAMVPVTPVGLETLALDALKRLGEQRVPVLPVVDADRVVGTISQQDLVRAMQFRQALARRRGFGRREAET